MVVGYAGSNEELSVAHYVVPRSALSTSIPHRLQSLCNEMAEGEAYTILSEKLADATWRRVLTTLDAQEFGCVIANVRYVVVTFVVTTRAAPGYSHVLLT